MSRLLDDAASDRLEVDVAVISGYPFTFACHVNTNDVAINQNCIWVGDKDVANEMFGLQVRASVAGDPVSAFAFSAASAFQSAETTTGVTVNTWHAIAGVYTNATDRDALIDGGSKGSNTTSSTPSGFDRTAMGRAGDISPGGHVSGQLSWGAVWNVVLTDAELAALSRGANPFAFRPASRVFLAPLHGNESPEPDYSSSQNNLVLSGTVKGGSNPSVELLENYL